MRCSINLPEGFDADAAIKAGTDVQGMIQALGKFIAMSDQDRRAMGQRGLKLVKERFNWEYVAKQMESVYAWILGGGACPECVHQYSG
jgi:poly(glycerol-phosphate) alpha-glucosyltransferase